MKVNIVSGPFVSVKTLVKLTPHDLVKEPVLVQIDSMDELSRKVKEVGATQVDTIGCICVFKEAY